MAGITNESHRFGSSTAPSRGALDSAIESFPVRSVAGDRRFASTGRADRAPSPSEFSRPHVHPRPLPLALSDASSLSSFPLEKSCPDWRTSRSPVRLRRMSRPTSSKARFSGRLFQAQDSAPPHRLPRAAGSVSPLNA